MAILNLRDLHRDLSQARHSAGITAAGDNIQTVGGNPLLTTAFDQIRFCTARILGLAYEIDGMTPLVDDEGNYQYQWVEEQRFINTGGFPEWHAAGDVPLDVYRGSIDNGDGTYKNLAHEANNSDATVNEHVVMWAGAQQDGDWEHIFYATPGLFYFELYGDLAPGNSVAGFAIGATPAATINLNDSPEANRRALGSVTMSGSHGARGKAIRQGSTGGGMPNYDIISIQQQARFIVVGAADQSGGLGPSLAEGATWNPTALTVMDPGGQDPSNGGASFSSVTCYTPFAIQAAGGAVSGICCIWDESVGQYRAIDGPC